jgi:hypothetical protein
VTLGQLANIADALDRGLDVIFPAVATEYQHSSEESGATDAYPVPGLAPTPAQGPDRRNRVATHGGCVGPNDPTRRGGPTSATAKSAVKIRLILDPLSKGI